MNIHTRLGKLVTALGKDVLVRTDDVSQHQPIPGTSRDFKGVDGSHYVDEEHFWEWYPERNMTTGAMRLTDYNFKKPTAMMEVDQTGDAAFEQGPQTAVVAGEGEIDCDEYGRILVHFHWDLEKAYSMRCRVSQNWASQGWGGMVIPRIGMEVIVEFLEGDPDKPIVTGCVYNAKNKVSYELPKHKTRSTFKMDTHKGTGFDELRFEDKKDEEEIFVHAQRDRNTKIENNQSERVNVNKVESVGHNKASEIGNNFFEIVEGDKDTQVHKSYTAKARKRIRIEAGDEILHICGKSQIKLTDDGTIETNGQKILGLGDKLILLQSDVVKIN